ncbi:phenylacetaldehyde reductase-like [Xenia sp. Carnegie-2017]|uniref:phenylacetaldehyde reductase-like n=1 Tax=Xenia sp. Carnegie-2017 TaxID=2897299 RepID=UPI001F04EC6C|nr:phenylacetaldehyde reductase-like [Xenia sp. Carnegie-2017]
MTTSMINKDKMAEEAKLVLVSGASGFVASHIIYQLLQSNEYRVRGTVRDVNNEEKTKPLKTLCPETKYPLELVQADLLNADSWLSAVKDCDYVIHVASPFPNATPKTEDEIIKPAVEGTTNVLEACVKSSTVKRVVLTSSCVAIYPGHKDSDDRILTEEDWAIVDECSAYEKSKALAEKSAWDFVKNLSDEQKFELVAINPGYVLGPVFHGSKCTSMEVHKMLLQREFPMLARLQMPMCDVRDVAAAHITSLTLPNAAGNRFIINTKSLWVGEVAEILKKEFFSQGYNVPTRYAPNFAIRFAGLFDKTLKMIAPLLGKPIKLSNEKMIKELGITPIEIEKTIIDMAYSLIDNGFIIKTNKYRGQKSQEKEGSSDS